MSAIARLTREMLDKKELELAEHLSILLADDGYDAGLFVAAILPKYWGQVGESQYTLPPRAIYRSLYYVEAVAGLHTFRERTRNFLDNISGHLEACLFHLYTETSEDANPHLPFGQLVQALHKRGVLSVEEGLWIHHHVRPHD